MDLRQDFEFATDTDTTKLVTVSRFGRRVDVEVRYVADVVLDTATESIHHAASRRLQMMTTACSSSGVSR